MSDSRPKILLIPHQPHRGVKVRTLEMARYLQSLDCYEIYVLTWEVSLPGRTDLAARLMYKGREMLKSATSPFSIDKKEGLSWVRLPYLLSPYPLAQRFNQQVLSRFIRQQEMDAVISANAYHFPVPRERNNTLYVYDVVDDHLSADALLPHWHRTRTFTLGEIQKADVTLTISHGLREILQKEGHTSELLPNGVDIPAFQPEDRSATDAVREKYDLAGKFTIGYIGNHGSWAGMDFLLEVFTEFHQQMPDSRLLIVGPGEDLSHYRTRYADEPAVIFTGAVPPADIAAYFHASDIGVLPFQLCPFTHHALPLKILEYGAARKRVLASPLQELKTLRFPHVDLLPLEKARWVDALRHEAVSPTPWQAGWDEVIARYNWPLLLAQLHQRLQSGLEAHT